MQLVWSLAEHSTTHSVGSATAKRFRQSNRTTLSQQKAISQVYKVLLMVEYKVSKHLTCECYDFGEDVSEWDFDKKCF